MTGARLAKDRVSQALTQVMTPKRSITRSDDRSVASNKKDL